MGAENYGFRREDIVELRDEQGVMMGQVPTRENIVSLRQRRVGWKGKEELGEGLGEGELICWVAW